MRLRPSSVLSCILPCLAAAAVAQQDPTRPPAAGNPAQGPGAPGSRETMWPAPTAEQWRLPVLVEFQRSWDDAMAVARRTRKPILACVNMDGEPASEHYAGIRYRQPDIAPLYEPYVCVIASVYRHNARDYDEQGRRILCPRFGSVTCGEHIALEPFLYEHFLDEKRIAPRHIMVELGGDEARPSYKEHYDVYYAPDTASVFQQIKDGVIDWPKPLPLSRDKTMLERVASRDIQDRTAVEQAYAAADAKQKRELLQAALASAGTAAPVDLLRLAVFGLDVELARTARQALAQCTSESATDLIVDALRVPMDAEERDRLVATLARIGESSPRAKLLAKVHQGLGARSSALDVAGWSKAIETADPTMATAAPSALESRIAYGERASRKDTKDPNSRAELADATLLLALERAGNATVLARGLAGKHLQLLFEDALRTAREAEALGAQGWRLQAAIAISLWNLGRYDDAYACAERAVTGMPSDAQDLVALNAVLVFAEARQKAISDAVRSKREWPQAWLADLNAAYSVLARHPLGADVHVAAHYDFLAALGAKGQAARVLDDGIARFPESWTLHDRLRGRILQDQGADRLEAAYDAMLAQPGASPNLPWFAGYAALVAAEHHRRSGAFDRARAAYDHAIAHYETLVQRRPDSKPNADHYAAIALAGKARMSVEHGDLAQGLDELLAAFTRSPASAGTLDGLNLSAADTMRALRARLIAAQQPDLLSKLDAAVAQLDPATLKPPAYEAPVPGARPFQRRRGG